jgi:hypothetical protein
LDALPPGASRTSRSRYNLACELARLCPPSLGQEIALTGSASLGLSDEHSDIELNFWTDALPAPDERAHWLRKAGATDITIDQAPIEDGSFWVTCHFQGVWIEAGWQEIDAQEALLRAILAGEVTEHARLMLAFIIQHAVSLRSSGLLAHWQQRLTHYPDRLQARLIEEASELWNFPHLLASWWVLPQRDERLRLHAILVRELHNALRILFALNRQWEPEWKWIAPLTSRLALQPDQLAERINEVFSSPPAEALRRCLQLIYETLLLVPAPHNVSRALATLEDSLRTHSGASKERTSNGRQRSKRPVTRSG